jgi:hypothetical protein
MGEPPRDHVINRSPRLELTHCRAICHEIGARLRLAFDRDRSPLLSRPGGLLDRFEEMDARARLQSSSKIDRRRATARHEGQRQQAKRLPRSHVEDEHLLVRQFARCREVELFGRF